MKKAITAASAAMLLVMGSGSVLAQDDEPAPPLRPVEAWTCDYIDGKTRADLDKVNAEWNKWMDETGQDHYTAFIMTPQFFGEWNFDVAWVGVAKDGNSFGKGTDRWLSEGGEIGAMFGEVVTCSSHASFVSMNVKRMPPSDEEGDGKFVIEFQNCSLEKETDGAFDEFIEAQEQWNAYADEHGFDYNSWVWWPIHGETDDSYDFKYVSAIADYTTFGANWQLYADGHWRKSNELLDSLLDCDIARAYDGTMLRWWADDE